MSPNYMVRCSLDIATEMARYERNDIVSKSNPSCRDIFKGSDLEEVYTCYDFVIEGVPLLGRWKSFGITVR